MLKLTIRCKTCNTSHEWHLADPGKSHSTIAFFESQGWVFPDESPILGEINSKEIFLWGLCPRHSIEDAGRIA